MRIRSDVGVFDIIGHLIVWFLLSLITFGIALFFFPYSFSKFILNRSAIEDEHGNLHDLNCDIELFGNIGHVILWFFISVLTFGLGYVFYFYKVWNYALNNTRTM
jgi:hypothetical protein